MEQKLKNFTVMLLIFISFNNVVFSQDTVVCKASFETIEPIRGIQTIKIVFPKNYPVADQYGTHNRGIYAAIHNGPYETRDISYKFSKFGLSVKVDTMINVLSAEKKDDIWLLNYDITFAEGKWKPTAALMILLALDIMLLIVSVLLYTNYSVNTRRTVQWLGVAMIIFAFRYASYVDLAILTATGGLILGMIFYFGLNNLLRYLSRYLKLKSADKWDVTYGFILSAIIVQLGTAIGLWLISDIYLALPLLIAIFVILLAHTPVVYILYKRYKSENKKILTKN